MNEKTLESINTIFQGLILLLQFILVIIPFIGTKALYDGRNTTKPFLERFSKKGKFFVSIGVLLIIISFSQTKISEKLNNIKDATTVKNDSLQSIANKTEILEASYKNTELLAKYGLKVDTKSNEIVKILKDPDSRKTTNNYGEDPVLELTEAIIDKETGKKIFLKFTSFESTSYDINVKIDIIATVMDQTFILVKNLSPIAENTTLVKNYSLDNTWPLDHFNILSVNLFYFRFFGSYKKSDGTIKQFEKYYAMDKFDPNGLGHPTSEMLKIIKDVYKNKNYIHLDYGLK